MELRQRKNQEDIEKWSIFFPAPEVGLPSTPAV